ncbi:hypothetical protein GCM10010174_24120 [Kutzneria viridogrisea]
MPGAFLCVWGAGAVPRKNIEGVCPHCPRAHSLDSRDSGCRPRRGTPASRVRVSHPPTGHAHPYR